MATNDQLNANNNDAPTITPPRSPTAQERTEVDREDEVDHFLCDDIRQLIISFLGDPLTGLVLDDSDEPSSKRTKSFPYLQNSLQPKPQKVAKKPSPPPRGKDSPSVTVAKRAPSFRPSRRSSSNSSSVAGGGARQAVKVLKQREKKTTKKENKEKTNLPPTKDNSGVNSEACGGGGGQLLLVATPDDILSVQLISHSWNVSFHRTWMEAPQVVVRRAIICNYRCYNLFARSGAAPMTTTTAGGDRADQSIEKPLQHSEEEEEQEEGTREALLADLRDLARIQKDFLEQNEVAVKTLEESQAMWARSTASLDCLRKECFQELKSYSHPPSGVVLVMQAVLTLLRQEPSWSSAKLIMQDSSLFIMRLKHYPIGSVSDKLLRCVKRHYVQRPEFDVRLLQKVSTAAAALAEWVIAVVETASVGDVLSQHLLKSKSSTASRGRSNLQQHDARAQFAIANEIISLHELLTSKVEVGDISTAAH